MYFSVLVFMPEFLHDAGQVIEALRVQGQRSLTDVKVRFLRSANLVAPKQSSGMSCAERRMVAHAVEMPVCASPVMVCHCAEGLFRCLVAFGLGLPR
jgi:hypothetical protein